MLAAASAASNSANWDLKVGQGHWRGRELCTVIGEASIDRTAGRRELLICLLVETIAPFALACLVAIVLSLGFNGRLLSSSYPPTESRLRLRCSLLGHGRDQTGQKTTRRVFNDLRDSMRPWVTDFGTIVPNRRTIVPKIRDRRQHSMSSANIACLP